MPIHAAFLPTFALPLAIVLSACTPRAQLEQADRSLGALVSGTPIRANLPSEVSIRTGAFSSRFRGESEIVALNAFFRSSQVGDDDPVMLQHKGEPQKVGKLTLRVARADVDYPLARAGNGSTLWILLVPDRSHPSASMFYFRDDGRFTKLLQTHQVSR